MQNITKYYDNFRALNNFNLNVEKGEILGLLGPNGAGKTTAMRILTCFLPKTSGTAKVAGFDIDEDSIEVRRRLGYLPEIPPIYPEMTVDAYLNFVAQIKEIPGSKINERIDTVCGRLGLTDYRNRILGTLSKGYKQRVGLAQALIHNPEVLILDEPTVGLDPNQIIEIRNFIKDLSLDHTIILSTHILDEVRKTCNRAVIINEGEVVKEDTVENLEKEGSGRPTWKISLKCPEGCDWKSEIDKYRGAEISSVTEGELTKFALKLDSEDDFDGFFERFISAGCVFREISPVRASLEDVFIKLTKGEEGDDVK